MVSSSNGGYWSLLKAVLSAGVFAFPYLFGKTADRLAHRITEAGVVLQEPGSKLLVESQHVVEDEYLTVTAGSGTDANGWDGK